MQCILPNNLNIMKTLSFQDLSLFKVKYFVPKLLLWLLHMYFSFRLTAYIQEGENTSNKNSCDIKYFTWKAQNMNEWSHENMLNLVSWHKTLECSKTVSCFSLQNSMKPAWQCVTVWAKCVLWNVHILIKLKEHNNSSIKSRLKNVQKLFCGWDAFRKKLGFLSCMNVMKRWLQTFSK